MADGANLKNLLLSSLLSFGFIAPSAGWAEGDATPKVTGIGGVFLVSTTKVSAKKLAEWYQKNLGIVPFQKDGTMAVFLWPDDKADDSGVTIWDTFEKNSEEMKQSRAQFMINYRVNDLFSMVAKLKRSKVELIGDIKCEFNGAFARILDPVGNKIELWEPKNIANGEANIAACEKKRHE